MRALVIVSTFLLSLSSIANTSQKLLSEMTNAEKVNVAFSDKCKSQFLEKLDDIIFEVEAINSDVVVKHKYRNLELRTVVQLSQKKQEVVCEVLSTEQEETIKSEESFDVEI